MSSLRKILVLGLLGILIFSGVNAWGYDPGVPDTVKITGGPLIVNQSIPLYLTIVNDEIIGAYSLGFEFTDTGGGFAVFDSAVYINRLEDPSIFAMRIVKYSNGDFSPGVSPDTLIMGADKYGGNPLPYGYDAIIALYYTGLTPGTMSIDSTFFPPAGSFILVEDFGPSIHPQYVPSQIEVIEGNLPPVFSHSFDHIPVTAGETISFEIDAESPDSYPVELQVVSLTGFDDSTVVPVNVPTLGGNDPSIFSWVTTSSDLGIWKLVVEACDSSSTCARLNLVLQVVRSDDYILQFGESSLENTCYCSGLTHGDFDGDLGLELVSAGSGQLGSPILQVFDYNNDEWQIAYSWESDGSFKYGAQVVYINDDKIPDFLSMASFSAVWYVELLLGDGQNSFSIAPGNNDGNVTRNLVAAEYTGDNYLDIASIWTDGVRFYSGDGSMGYSQYSYMYVANTALGINSADFNGDGFNDLAVGCEDGIRIYLGDGAGGFDAGEFYSQTYGSIEIEVTNQGSDFNNDDIFDLCVSTPSSGGANSEMMIYLGNGDGTFEQHMERLVKGHIFGNCVSDFNSDGELDIAYVNGSQKYFAILFGDGDGSFTNEIRIDVPHIDPHHIDCFDHDLDGDVDIMIAAMETYFGGNQMFFYENNLNPAGFYAGGCDIFACNNANIELTSASGLVFNKNRNTMPSGEMYHCNLDNDNELDIMATMNVVEQGEYVLQAMPKPGSSRDNFTLEFDLNGKSYRLAHDIPMNPEGYTFNICLGQSSPVYPRPGRFVYSNPPTFSWQGEGSFDFQLASDIDFNDVIINTGVDGSSYQPAEELPLTDTATYYWRIKPAGQPEFECRYVINLLSGSPGDCGDANSDGTINVADAVFLINYVFVGGDAPDPLQIGDANCDGLVNVSDAVIIINYIFTGGNIPCDMDGDGLPDC